MIRIFLALLIGIICGTIIYFAIDFFLYKKAKNRIKSNVGNVYFKIKDYLDIIARKKLLPNKFHAITPFLLIIIMFFLFTCSFFLIFNYVKIFSTSVILAIPISLTPIFAIKLLINHEKNKINKMLPMYAVNLKNHVSEDNNIIKAIQITNVEQPLNKYIAVFKNNIKRGVNVIESFETLKTEINVKNFSNLVIACETCYLSGGNFTKVLEQFINIMTKEITHKESAKEKAYSDILTLVIMIILNALVIVMFVFTNKDYASIIRDTFFGRAILSFNALSYIFIIFLVSKIYKEE